MLYRKWFTVLSLFVIAALILTACDSQFSRLAQANQRVTHQRL